MVLVLLMRLALGILAWLGLVISPDFVPAGDYTNLQTPVGAPWWFVVGPWQRWDALWFQHLATDGYQTMGSGVAFFPLFPMVIRGVAVVIGGDAALAAIIVSTASFIVALALLDILVSRDLDSATARRTVLLVAMGPTALFFYAGYSESLLLALSIGAFLCARQRRWAIAGMCGLLAGLCRSTGVLLTLPLAVEAVQHMRERRAAEHRSLTVGHFAVAAPVVGLLLWVAYSSVVLNVSGGPIGAASSWGQRPAMPWVSISRSIGVILDGSRGPEVLNLAAVGLLVAGCVAMVRRLPFSYTAYAVASIPVLCFRTADFSPLMSASRYVIVVFPLFVIAALLLRRTWGFIGVLSVSTIVLGGNLFMFSHNLLVL